MTENASPNGVTVAPSNQAPWWVWPAVVVTLGLATITTVGLVYLGGAPYGESQSVVQPHGSYNSTVASYFPGDDTERRHWSAMMTAYGNMLASDAVVAESVRTLKTLDAIELYWRLLKRHRSDQRGELVDWNADYETFSTVLSSKVDGIIESPEYVKPEECKRVGELFKRVASEIAGDAWGVDEL